MIEFDVFIPARFASKRLPGKPLRDIAGKSLIERVYECALQSSARSVWVATDDRRIKTTVDAFGGNVCMTSPDLNSGTDRVAEAVAKLELPDERVVVNLQGDEPMVPGEALDQVVHCLTTHPEAKIATLCRTIKSQEEYQDPNVVKVVTDSAGYALYFSRSPIPYQAQHAEATQVVPPARHHVGIYAYRADYLKDFAARSACEIEETERLEQLRALWHGDAIAVCDLDIPTGFGIDTPDDLERAVDYFAKRDRAEHD